MDVTRPHTVRNDPGALLSVRGLTVVFGGQVAVSEVDLDVPAGSVTGLIGPNGAGKTTTFNALTGLLTPTRGQVVFDGRDISGWATHRRARLGIGRTFQRLEVFTSLTVRENIAVAVEIRRRWSAFDLRSRWSRSGIAAEVDGLLDRLGLGEVGDESAGSLSTGRSRLVEIARALAIRPRLLLLDEPASGQDDEETERFGELITSLAGDGLAILMVEHDVPLVMRTCERIHVLDFGRIIASGTPAEIQSDPVVQEAYLGASGSEIGT